MGQLSHEKGSFSKCFGSKNKKVMLFFWGNFSAAWLFRYLVSSSLERKELRRCFEPKVFCFIPTPCWCTSTPSWCVGNYLPFTFSVLSRIVTTFFRLASLLKPVWVYTARRSSACSSVTRSIAGPSPFFICTSCWKNRLFLGGLDSLEVASLPTGLKTARCKLGWKLDGTEALFSWDTVCLKIPHFGGWNGRHT